MLRLSVLILMTSMRSFAQETDYTAVFIDYQLPPSLPQYNAFKTFDVAVVTSQAVGERKTLAFNLPYQVKAGSLEQVDSTGDFHVVCLLQRFAGATTSPSTGTLKIGMTTTVFDKFGKVVTTYALNNENLALNFGRELTKAELGNQEFMRRIGMEKAIEISLKSFTDALYGSKLRPQVKVASLDDVKKKPELQEFDVQAKALVKSLDKEGLPGFKNSAQPYLAYWEKMSNYTGEGEVNEVKRAAYHNLALYNIAAGNSDKAREYLELYKPIDKTVKEMFGLIKYKNSEECEKLLTSFFPAPAPAVDLNAGRVLNKTEILDDYQFLKVNGTVTISSKKDGGTYNGVIKVYKIPTNSFGNIINLDPENIAVSIVTNDNKTIETTISKIDELKDNNGTSYTSQKFGNAMLGDGSYYVFMQSSYSSPKITVYRAILPVGSAEYVVKKAGDDKGVKSSLFGARKNLIEYLADCPSVAEKMKDGTIGKNETPEKIAEMYTKCDK